MILVIDNYDSFTYNLVQYLGELGAEVRVRRNNEVTIGEIEAMAPEQILISPGPGRPEGAGVTLERVWVGRKSRGARDNRGARARPAHRKAGHLHLPAWALR